MSGSRASILVKQLRKTATGIAGFDEITSGGLPQGRPTLVCGGPGSGKTLFGMEFLVRGAREFDEPGVFMSFEEKDMDLVENFSSLGFDLDDLVTRNKMALDYVHFERNEILETGEFDLEGLFVRLGYAIDTIGARRVVLDTIEALFSGFPNEGILRAEIRRLFRWLKDRGVTAVITCEQGRGTLTRHGLEEYVSDCVILLDHRMIEQVATRRLRIIKYRGTTHGTNEYPFLIDEGGLYVLPITSLGLTHKALTERISSGIPRLDTMLGGEGYYRGSSILITGTAGTGKTSLAAHFASSACLRGERCLYLAFEESESQIVRNMRSIGVDLQPWLDNGLLHFHATRPSFYGLEMHLVSMNKLVRDFKPSVVIMDPVSNMISVGSAAEVKSALMRFIDSLKMEGITALFTCLISGQHQDLTDMGVSALMDTWATVQDIEINGERNRGLYVIKSRGMAHSNQVREFVLSSDGVHLIDVYIGPGGVLTGAARLAQEAKDRANAKERTEEIERKKREFASRKLAVDAQVSGLLAELSAQEAELEKLAQQEAKRKASAERELVELARQRHAD
ncbi:KaiC-like protein 1 [Syntrophobacter sp. SbD1]|nr:KaiC-like protein 1 [Syntrophobacter sp. SbD1]